MSARDDLQQVLQRGFALDLRDEATVEPLSTTPLRRSAVLMLFAPHTPGDLTATAPELDVLLTQRGPQLRHHPGQIAFPGGGIEPIDSGPEQAALREAAEETGIDPAGVDILGTLPHVRLRASNNLVTPVIGWWRLPVDTVADTHETVEVWRVPVDRLLDPAVRGTSVLDFAGGVHRGPAFQLQDGGSERIVWGFTGILLSTLFDQVGWTRPWDPSKSIRVTA